MRVECEGKRIYLIPENNEDENCLINAVPNASQTFCFYTYDGGKSGKELALVITHIK